MENLDPLPQNQSAFFPSRDFILDFFGVVVVGGLLGVAVSFYSVQDWSSWVPKFFLGEQILSPFYKTSFRVGIIYSTKETITI